jgi:hypothetical protein
MPNVASGLEMWEYTHGKADNSSSRVNITQAIPMIMEVDFKILMKSLNSILEKPGPMIFSKKAVRAQLLLLLASLELLQLKERARRKRKKYIMGMSSGTKTRR